MLQHKLDTITTVETPEAIDVILRPAGVLPRALAFLIDFLIRITWFFTTLIIFLFMGSFGQGLILLNAFFTIWMYYVVCEVRFNGCSIGKRIVGLRVVNDDGTPIQFYASLLRNLLRTADVLPMMYTFGILSSSFHPQSKRLGDLVAGTLVVYVDKPKQRPNIEPVPPIPCPVPLTKEEQSAILVFAERNNKLSFDRQLELAMIVAPALGVSRANAVPFLRGIAQDIAGESRQQRGKV